MMSYVCALGGIFYALRPRLRQITRRRSQVTEGLESVVGSSLFVPSVPRFPLARGLRWSSP